MDARPIQTTRILHLLLAVALLASLAALPPSASGGPSTVAQSAKKKCKKKKPGKGAYGAKKKCKKKKKPGAPPGQPVVPPPPPDPASLSISPDSYGFGTVAPGDSPPHTFTVTNSGGSASGSLASSLGGNDPANYEISANTCNGAALAAGSSCTLDVNCTTSEANGVTRTATLTVAGAPGGSPAATLTCFETT